MWECSECGRDNEERYQVCPLCGTGSPAAEPELDPREYLAAETARLSREYGKAVSLGIIGMSRDLTRADVEQMVQEAEADLQAEAAEAAYEPVERVDPTGGFHDDPC